MGDAARHVNPITGGGIHTALSGGQIAGHFLAGFLNEGTPPTAQNLEGYQNHWLEELGNKMLKLYDVKTDIFRKNDIRERDALLYQTMASYFSPHSEYKKI